MTPSAAALLLILAAKATTQVLAAPTLPSPPLWQPSSLSSSASQQPPWSVLGLPRGPLITARNNSEVARLPAFPTFPDEEFTRRENCPHESSSPALKLWSDPSTWPGGLVPANSSSTNVTLPANTAVLFTAASSPLFLGFLTIPASSSLVFDDSVPSSSSVLGDDVEELQLHTSGISVVGSGAALVAGSETCRMVNRRLRLTFHGSRPSPYAMLSTDPAIKGLVAMDGGRIELHGALYTATWSRLASTAAVNDTWIFLQDSVNWEAGQEIAVMTTAWKEDRTYRESEVVKVRSAFRLPDNITAVEIFPPLTYRHYAGRDYQAEVALLSRRIVVEGSADDSEPTDKTPLACDDGYHSRLPCPNSYRTGYGAHVMVMGASSVGKFSGVELTRVGQTNVLGRYPIHFHLLYSNGYNSFVQDCSVHRSYYRAFAVHATNNTRLHRNVAFDVQGHAIYFEDGIEENNEVFFNIAALVHPIGPIPTDATSQGQFFPSATVQNEWLRQPADIAASGFYFLNARQKIIGNAAVGGWSGYSFPNANSPIGLHRSWSPFFIPKNRPIIEFRGNTARSTGTLWDQAGGIYCGGDLSFVDAAVDATSELLQYNPGRSNPGRQPNLNGVPVPDVFQDFKASVMSVGAMHWGDRTAFERVETIDVLRSMTVFGRVTISNLLITCRSPNLLLASTPGNGKYGYEGRLKNWDRNMFQSYDTGQSHLLSNVTFRACLPWQSWMTIRPWAALTHSDQFVPEQMLAARGVKYEPGSVDTSIKAPPLVAFTVPDKQSVSGMLQSIVDADGSLTFPAIAAMAAASNTTAVQKPILMGSAIAGDWWRLDKRCKQPMNWQWYLCDYKASSPSSSFTPSSSSATPSSFSNRGVASLYLNYDSPLQSTVGSTICTNGGPEPCPFVGRVGHIGWSNATSGMPLSPHPKLTGPVGGFGWHVRWAAGAPVKLAISQVQLNQSDILMVAMPYPKPGGALNLNVTLFNPFYPTCPSWCRPDWGCVCAYSYRRVSSIREVRYGRGDEMYWDSETGWLYFQVTRQPTENSVLSPTFEFRKPHFPPDLAFDGMTISAKQNSWSPRIVVEATNCVLSPSNPLYCQLPQDEASLAYTPPVSAFCAPGEVAGGYDLCALPDPSPSPTPTPTFSAAASVSASVATFPSTSSSSAAMSRSPAVSLSPLPAPSRGVTMAVSRVEFTMRMAVNGSAIVMSSSTSVESTGAALCTALASAIEQRVLSATTMPAGSSVEVSCVRSIPLWKRKDGGRQRRVQAQASPLAACDPSTCLLSGFNISLALVDTAPLAPSTSADPAAAAVAMAKQAVSDTNGLLLLVAQQLASSSAALSSLLQAPDGSLSASASLAVEQAPVAVAVASGSSQSPSSPSPAAAPGDASSSSGSDGLSTAAIAGIAGGSVAVVLLAVLGIAGYLRWNRLKSAITPPQRGYLSKSKAIGSITPRSLSGQLPAEAAGSGIESSAFLGKASGKTQTARKSSVAAAMAAMRPGAQLGPGANAASRVPSSNGSSGSSGFVASTINPTFHHLASPSPSSSPLPSSSSPLPSSQGQRHQRTQRALGSVIVASSAGSSAALASSPPASAISFAPSPLSPSNKK